MLIGAGSAVMFVVSTACVKVDTGRENRTDQTVSTAASATAPTAGAEAHNTADVWFVRHMIPHDQQQIETCALPERRFHTKKGGSQARRRRHFKELRADAPG